MLVEDAVQKKRAASVSLICNVGLTVIKLFAAGLTGSVGMLSEAVHSATDIVASALAFVSVRVAMAPPDEEHPYGHGKVETVAGFGESILLLGICAFLAYESIHRLFFPEPVMRIGLGVGVMAGSALVSLLVGRYIDRVAAKTNSLALRSNGRHMMSDFWTSLSVLATLGIYHFTKWQGIDAVMGLLIAAWLARSSWKMTKYAFNELIDHRVETHEVDRIKSILDDDVDTISYHRLRTRHSGVWHYVEVHVVVPREWSVVQAHDHADRLEKAIAQAIMPAQVVIHIDPYDEEKASRGR